jgi:hypothetical protein
VASRDCTAAGTRPAAASNEAAMTLRTQRARIRS